MRARFGSAFALFAIVAAICAPGPLHAADGDMQQYNRTAMNVEAACGLAPLTSALYLPTDGKRITADSNAAGSAPVNRGLKQAADYWTCVRCAVIGDCGGGINQRTLKSVHVDGTGGVVSSAGAGEVKANVLTAVNGLYAQRTVVGTSNPSNTIAAGEYTKDTNVACLISFTKIMVGFTIFASAGVESITALGAGDYAITCKRTGLATEFKNIVWASAPIGVTTGIEKSLDLSARLVIRVKLNPASDIGPIDVSAMIF